MSKLGLWQVSEGKLIRINESSIDLENDIENWIVDDPSLVQPGLEIVGRQISLEGGCLDLLAIDTQGRWVVIEIKKGTLYRETIAQVLDYASCIATVSEEELRSKLDIYLGHRDTSLDVVLDQRDALTALDAGQRELAMIIVGTGRGPGLDRMAQFLNDKYDTPITIVTFEVFLLDDGKVLLAREITETETVEKPSMEKPKVTIESVLKLAELHGTASIFRHCLEVADRLNIHPRPWKTSIMFAPSTNKTRTLFTLWVRPKGDLLKMYVERGAFHHLLSVSEETVLSHIKLDKWQYLTEEQMDSFLSDMEAFFKEIRRKESADSDS